MVLVPYDLGRENVGQGSGPVTLLDAGARRVLSDAGHRVRGVHRIRLTPDTGNEVGNVFALARALSRAIREIREGDRIPIVLAGSCSSAIGVMAGLLPEGPTGLVWFDAHGDANTPETSESGYLDGMPLAVIVGWCWRKLARSVPGFVPIPEESVIHVGGRDFDLVEGKRLSASGIRIVPARTMRSAEGAGAMARAVRRIARQQVPVSLHVDLDVIDKKDGLANRFAAPGGPRLEAIEGAICRIGAAAEVKAITLCSYDPRVDHDGLALRSGLRLLSALASTVPA